MKVEKSNCRKCCRETRHEVLFAVEHGASEFYYNEKHIWQVLRCLGCETVAFRYTFEDHDLMEELPSGRQKPSVSYFRYPGSLPGHKPLDELWTVPDLIRKVYKQTLTSMANGAFILAGIGLRANIEAVCNHLQVSGGSLEKRIDNLFKGGFISNSDRRRLHAIRFLGNDAAHEILELQLADLRVALEIVEHLINTVFILDAKSKDLDVEVDSYEGFIKLLETCAKRHKIEQPSSLAGILGKSKRRVVEDLSKYEPQIAGRNRSWRDQVPDPSQRAGNRRQQGPDVQRRQGRSDRRRHSVLTAAPLPFCHGHQGLRLDHPLSPRPWIRRLQPVVGNIPSTDRTLLYSESSRLELHACEWWKDGRPDPLRGVLVPRYDRLHFISKSGMQRDVARFAEGRSGSSSKSHFSEPAAGVRLHGEGRRS